MSSLERLQAERDCLRLMSDYCWHMDTRNFAAFAELFTEDGVLAKATLPPYEQRGRKEILAHVERRPPENLSRHFLLNHAIDIESNDRARGKAVGLVVRGVRDREDWPMPIRGVEVLLDYRMSFELRSGRWLISRSETQRIMDIETKPN